MSATERLSDEQVQGAIRTRISGWAVENGAITRTYQTGAWTRTMMIANAIAYVAERVNHHPDLLLSYPRLKVMLTTHDAGGITEKDVALAEEIERVAAWQPAGSALSAESWIG